LARNDKLETVITGALAKSRDQSDEGTAEHVKTLKRYKGYKVKKAIAGATDGRSGRSQFDRALEDEFGWPGQRHTDKALTVTTKINA
jgi:hypothetical protein